MGSPTSGLELQRGETEVSEVIPVDQLERYDSFVHELEELLNKHKVYLSADREGNVQIESMAARKFQYVTVYQTIYRDSYTPSHIYYELQTELV